MKTLKILLISIIVSYSSSVLAQFKVMSDGSPYIKGHVYFRAYEGDGQSGTAILQARDMSGSSNLDFLFRTQYNGSIVNAMRIDKHGAVSIDATRIQDYWSALQVKVSTKNSGAFSLWNSYYNNDVFYVRGDGYVWTRNGWLTASDIKFKTDIAPIPSSLDKILLLEGVKYKRKYTISNSPDSAQLNNVEQKTEISDRFEYGLIAQDVEKVIPEVVHDMKDGSKAISYTEIIPILIEALKQQQKQIDELKKSVKNDVSLLKSTSDSNSETINKAALENIAALYQNSPNPFNENTTIAYYIPGSVSKATLCIYNLQGNQIKAYDISSREKGSITINGFELNPGMYLYALIVDGKEVDTKRMILTN